MDHVEIIDGHWMWTGSNSRGYGRFSINRRGIPAHRAAWLLFRGEIPEGLQVHHLCYRKGCVNPDHLEPRTARDNNLDVSPLRQPRKPKSPHRWRKAVCKHGHPMEGENIAWTTHADGRRVRYCRECARIMNRAQYAKHIEARRAYARAYARARYVPRV
jgi:hypothetical protein